MLNIIMLGSPLYIAFRSQSAVRTRIYTRSYASSTWSNKMAARIEYDDSGSTTFYFILSIYLLVLLPVSYFLLPKKKNQKEDGRYEGALCVRGQYNRKTVLLVLVQYMNRNA